MGNFLNFPAASICGIGKKESVFRLNTFPEILVLMKL
jgi:hypothetical protein